jgi:hypothetical protein
MKFKLAVLLTVLSFASADLGAAANHVTICELISDPTKNSNKLIEVSAQVRATFDNLFLIDSGCPRSSLALLISNKTAKKASVRPLWAAIYRQGNIGTVGKRITATFVGTYESSEEASAVGTLKLQGIRNLKVLVDPVDPSKQR